MENSYLAEINRIAERQINKGIEKYGQVVQDNPEDAFYWIDYAIEEAVDFIFYLLRLRDEITKYQSIKTRKEDV